MCDENYKVIWRKMRQCVEEMLGWIDISLFRIRSESCVSNMKE